MENVRFSTINFSGRVQELLAGVDPSLTAPVALFFKNELRKTGRQRFNEEEIGEILHGSVKQYAKELSMRTGGETDIFQRKTAKLTASALRQLFGGVAAAPQFFGGEAAVQAEIERALSESGGVTPEDVPRAAAAFIVKYAPHWDAVAAVFKYGEVELHPYEFAKHILGTLAQIEQGVDVDRELSRPELRHLTEWSRAEARRQCEEAYKGTEITALVLAEEGNQDLEAPYADIREAVFERWVDLTMNYMGSLPLDEAVIAAEQEGDKGAFAAAAATLGGTHFEDEIFMNGKWVPMDTIPGARELWDREYAMAPDRNFGEAGADHLTTKPNWKDSMYVEARDAITMMMLGEIVGRTMETGGPGVERDMSASDEIVERHGGWHEYEKMLAERWWAHNAP